MNPLYKDTEIDTDNFENYLDDLSCFTDAALSRCVEFIGEGNFDERIGLYDTDQNATNSGALQTDNKLSPLVKDVINSEDCTKQLSDSENDDSFLLFVVQVKSLM